MKTEATVIDAYDDQNKPPGGIASIVAVVPRNVPSSPPLHAAEESVDELIHNALQLDVDPARGEALYRKHCVSCHGAKASWRPGRAAFPALAGQRQAYVVKQLADFRELERNSAACTPSSPCGRTLPSRRNGLICSLRESSSPDRQAGAWRWPIRGARRGDFP